jgi:hypothetical protein
LSRNLRRLVHAMILKNPGGDWRGVLRFGVLNKIQLFVCVNLS